MRASPFGYEALARALTPPRGEVHAFRDLGLPSPDVDALVDEHATLFGRLGRAVLAPYEGVHRGTSLHQVLTAYARFGFAPDASFRDRPDHVCLQLALAAALNRRARGAAECGSPAQALRAREEARQFFHLRIWPWVPVWFDKLTSFEEYPVHRSLAFVAGEFLAEEGVRWGAPGRAPQDRREPVAQPRCAECGRPVGFVSPRRDAALPPWALVCVRCRLRFDLRRFGS
ncbi:MAG: TorD/DmsD family molecular chaperone [Planctomycetota bacterium]